MHITNTNASSLILKNPIFIPTDSQVKFSAKKIGEGKIIGGSGPDKSFNNQKLILPPTPTPPSRPFKSFNSSLAGRQKTEDGRVRKKIVQTSTNGSRAGMDMIISLGQTRHRKHQTWEMQIWSNDFPLAAVRRTNQAVPVTWTATERVRGPSRSTRMTDCLRDIYPAYLWDDAMQHQWG